MIVECPGCKTIFPVDPKKVPTGGVHARCSVCSEVFFVSVPEPEVDIVEKDGIGAPEEVAAEAAQDASAGEETESGAEESPEVFDEAVESVVEESETTFEEAVESVSKRSPRQDSEAEPSFGEPERTFGEAETAFAPPEPEFVETVEEPPEPTPVTAPLFGKRDPMEKAQRLARVLVSDIILYNPDRHHDATESGRVKEEFRGRDPEILE